MLDDSSESEKDMMDIKKKLTILMHSDEEILPKFTEIFKMQPTPSLAEIMLKIGNPLKRMNEMF
jgi:hypothetical protein